MEWATFPQGMHILTILFPLYETLTQFLIKYVRNGRCGCAEEKIGNPESVTPQTCGTPRNAMVAPYNINKTTQWHSYGV